MAPSSRLLTLLQEALSYEKEHGLLPEGEQLDVFRNVVETVVLEDAVPTVKVGLLSDDQLGDRYPVSEGQLRRGCVHVSEWPVFRDGKRRWADRGVGPGEGRDSERVGLPEGSRIRFDEKWDRRSSWRMRRVC